MTEIDKKTITSVVRVLNTLKENEGDSDHISMINSALERLWELYGDEVDVNTDNLTKEDVKTTVNFLEEHAPSRREMMSYRANNNGDRHPNRTLEYMSETVDLSARYANRCLPSYRNWNVEYICDGEVIEERTYDYDDEIPTEPVIDDVRYECDSTKRGNGEVVVYVSKHPIREDVDIVINAEGDDFINIESHNGPNVPNDTYPIDILSDEFDWGMLGPTKIIINDKPDNIIKFIESKNWKYEYA